MKAERIHAFRNLIHNESSSEERPGLTPSPRISTPAAPRLILCNGCEPNCRECKRTMIPDEVFANGFNDGPSLCHACKQKKMEREPNRGVYGWDRESTEGR